MPDQVYRAQSSHSPTLHGWQCCDCPFCHLAM
jgi:hypothetical protein